MFWVDEGHIDDMYSEALQLLLYYLPKSHPLRVLLLAQLLLQRLHLRHNVRRRLVLRSSPRQSFAISPKQTPRGGEGCP